MYIFLLKILVKKKRKKEVGSFIVYFAFLQNRFFTRNAIYKRRKIRI